MGYRIVYGPLRRARWWEKRGLRVFVFSLIWFGVLLMVISQGREGVWELLLPGRVSVTAGAFSAFEEALGGGESVIGAFCRFWEVIFGTY